MRIVATLVFASMLAVPAAAQQKEVLPMPGVLEGLPFSPVVKVGNMLYLSGQIGTAPGAGLVEGGVEAEVRQTLENIATTLERAGSSMENVVKCTVFLADIADYQAMNDIYRTFFPKDPPARSTIAASGLAIGAKVEIECMAVVG